MKSLVVANWKMNTSLADAVVLATLVRNQLQDLSSAEVVLCPPYVWLQEVAAVLEIAAPHLRLGAQNCHPGHFGAMTGEVSTAMLKDLCSYVIVGHSERRAHFKESSDEVSDKVQSVLQNGMTPILCVGELSKSSHSIDLVIDQLKKSLEGVSRDEQVNVVIAYEPVWSISTNTSGELATGEYATEVIGRLKQHLPPDTMALYGGSVNEENIADFIKHDTIDGVLVGGASLKAKQFVEIAQKVDKR